MSLSLNQVRETSSPKKARPAARKKSTPTPAQSTASPAETATVRRPWEGPTKIPPQQPSQNTENITTGEEIPSASKNPSQETWFDLFNLSPTPQFTDLARSTVKTLHATHSWFQSIQWHPELEVPLPSFLTRYAPSHKKSRDT